MLLLIITLFGSKKTELIVSKFYTEKTVFLSFNLLNNEKTI